MKTQNLTKWSNLYSTELKCNLTVKPSLFPLELVLGLLFIFLLFTIFTNEKRAVLAWQYAFLSTAFIFIVHRFSVWLLRFQQRNQNKVIEINGIIQSVRYGLTSDIANDSDDSNYLLSSHSRVAYWGFYLVLNGPDNDQTYHGLFSNNQRRWFGHKNKHKLVFIDKRQLSKQQYSQLAFIIKRTQNTPLSSAGNRQSSL